METFEEWLREQCDRDDPIGDLARDFIADEPGLYKGYNHSLIVTRIIREAKEEYYRLYP